MTKPSGIIRQLVKHAGWLLLLSCDLYPSWDGNFNAGPVDPVNYPPPYLGTGADRTRAGSGSFSEVAAYVNGERTGYYAFPFPTAALPSATAKTPPDTLAVSIAGNANPNLPVPTVATFDGTPGERAFSTSAVCQPAKGYSYDPRRDDVRYDEQSAVFSVLPQATYSTSRAATWGYAPVVAEVSSSNTGPCQDFRVMPSPTPGFAEANGFFLAWALIDPAAPVYRLGQTASNANGVSAQRYGWFNNYLVAFLDGGYIPTVNDTQGDGSIVVHMVPQRLFYPRSQIVRSSGNTAGALGQGYDVLEAKRDGSGYSPVCAVFTYDAGAPLQPDALPKDVATIEASFGPSVQPANPPYVFCLQAEVGEAQ